MTDKTWRLEVDESCDCITIAEEAWERRNEDDS